MIYSINTASFADANTNYYTSSDSSRLYELRKSPYSSGVVGSLNASTKFYDFTLTEDGTYKLFSFTPVDSTVASSGNYGSIVEETNWGENYITVDDNILNGNQLVSGSLTVAKDFILTSPNIPTSVSSSGTKGQFAFDGTCMYFCTGSNAWVKTVLSQSFGMPW